jgi:hypothetical protein
MGWELLFGLPHLAPMVRRAFSKPWQGTSDQWTTLIVAACLLVVAGMAFSIWSRHGLAGLRKWVEARQAARRAYWESGAWRHQRISALLFWIGVALLLVVWFNTQQKSSPPRAPTVARYPQN